jgi:hypothetical protein
MIQSVMFDKKIWGIPQAVEWLINKGYVFSKVDVGKNYYRFRQLKPSKKDKYITRKLKDGINIIVKI